MFLFAVIGNATYVARYPTSLYYLLYFKSQHQSDFCQLKLVTVWNYHSIFNERLVFLLMQYTCDQLGLVKNQTEFAMASRCWGMCPSRFFCILFLYIYLYQIILVREKWILGGQSYICRITKITLSYFSFIYIIWPLWVAMMC